MPELPEVEAIKLQLGKFLKGHKILSVEIKYPKTFQGDPKDLIGGEIIGTRRFGKVTVIDLDNNFSLLTHVKLTGQFIYKGPNLIGISVISTKVIGGVPGPHTLVIFNLDKGGTLYYNDVRRFGWIKIVKTEEVKNESFIKKLGPEPPVVSDLTVEKLTLEKFKQILSKTTRAIKIVLLDQSKLSGVGNIYANDALWLAKINPKTPANKLSPGSVTALYNAVTEVLVTGIKFGGSSESTFVTPDGKEGNYQKHSLVYGRQGQPCLRCEKQPDFVHSTKLKTSKGLVEKYFLGGRGTYWCPVCQK